MNNLMYKTSDLDKHICDIIPESSNIQTLREWIHDIHQYLYKEDVSDEEINNMSEQFLNDFVEELDWLSWK